MKVIDKFPFGGIGAVSFGIAYIEKENLSIAIPFLVVAIICSGLFYYKKYLKKNKNIQNQN